VTDDAAHEVMSWSDLGDGAGVLAEQIHRDGYRPDIVLAIARGGCSSAGRSATRSA